MEALIIILIAVVLLVVVGGTFFLRGRDSGTDVLERPVEAPPTPVETDVEVEVETDVDVVVEPEPEVITRPSFRERLARARESLAGTIGSILSRGVDNQTWEELEEALIRADVGLPATMSILDSVREKAEADNITDAQQVLDLLKAELTERLGGFDRSLARADADPSVWLFVGVNGVGKTTTIGKLAKQEIDEGSSVVMAAGDTFRAAAGEQLEMWADRSGATIVRGNEGGDPSAVVFDAVEHAAAKGADLVLADTAGRLHTKSNLMEELGKVRRVAEKGAGTVSEVLLVLDATTGQNGLTQVQQFTEAVDVTGVVLTKLDGSAKGGIVVAIQQELGIPVKLVGLGEGLGDLVAFDETEFVDALFSVGA
ncbi:MAG: signal recognition particle-docking protein FtsY [Acidimicrobiales bacterium]